MNREDLIARKGAVRAEIAQVVRRLEGARRELEDVAGLRQRFLAGQVRSLESRLEALTAEEARLRLDIDRRPAGEGGC